MAFTLISAPDSVPTSTADWAKINNVLLTIGMALLSPARISGGNVIRGSVVHFAGAWYVTDSDTAISGTASNYVKLTNTAGTVTASYSANLTGVSWNKTWNGYYNAGGEYFIFDVMKARGAGLISDTYGLTFWQPQDAGMAKFLGAALSPTNLTLPITNGSTSGVKYRRISSTSPTVTHSGDHTNTLVKTFTLSTLNGVTCSTPGIYVNFAYIVAPGQTVTIKVFEDSSEIYSATKTSSGGDTPYISLSGSITGSARTFYVKFSASGGDPGIRMSSLATYSYLYVQPSSPTLSDIYAERIVGGIYDTESVITEDFS